jgi:hypothetical protein
MIMSGETERKKFTTKPGHVVEDKFFIPTHRVHVHIRRSYIKGHETTLRNGKKKKIPGHWIIHHVKVYDQKGHEVERKTVEFGGHSHELYQQIYNGYMQKWKEHKWMKGKTKEQAEKEAEKYAGGAIGNIYRHKLAEYKEGGK